MARIYPASKSKSSRGARSSGAGLSRDLLAEPVALELRSEELVLVLAHDALLVGVRRVEAAAAQVDGQAAAR